MRSGGACGGISLSRGSREPSRRVSANALRLRQPRPAARPRNPRPATTPLRVRRGAGGGELAKDASLEDAAGLLWRLPAVTAFGPVPPETPKIMTVLARQ